MKEFVVSIVSILWLKCVILKYKYVNKKEVFIKDRLWDFISELSKWSGSSNTDDSVSPVGDQKTDNLSIRIILT